MSPDLPYWPRRLRAGFASAYVGVSKAKFLADVKGGQWPAPIHDGGCVLWDRHELDELIDRKSGRVPQTPVERLREEQDAAR